MILSISNSIMFQAQHKQEVGHLLRRDRLSCIFHRLDVEQVRKGSAHTQWQHRQQFHHPGTQTLNFLPYLTDDSIKLSKFWCVNGSD